jgi:AbrB family looped-hinge helix DNA binding protein
LTIFPRSNTIHTNQIFITYEEGRYMADKDVWQDFKCLGSATVGPRGQVVIPAGARKELGMEAGTTLLVFLGPGGKGLFLFKAEAVEQIVRMLSENLSSVEKVLKGYAPSVVDAGSSREEDNEKED